MTYARGFSWGRQQAGAVLLAMVVSLGALMAAPPPPGTDTARATGRLARTIARQLSHASNGPARAFTR
jgi:hypothetical protein